MELQCGIVGEPEPVSVVVPVFNSQQFVPILFERVAAVFAAETRTFELILIDDRSRDDSWEVVADLAARHSHVPCFRMLRNYGQHNALLCGIRAAKYPIVVTADDDLQNPPEEIPRMLARLDSNTDVVTARRWKRVTGCGATSRRKSPRSSCKARWARKPRAG